jgi:AsmA family
VTATRVKSVPRRLIRIGLIAVLLLLIAGLIAPLIDAAQYKDRIREALQASLARKVDFGEIHFALFSGPGFSLEDVTIYEDPRYGLEPFAYVPTLQVRLRIDKLLLGHIQFSSLRLVEPLLNIVKRNDGAWNIVELVERLSTPQRVSLNLFPAVEISAGRLNFKFATRKTTLYVAGSDISIYPERSGKLYIQFSGSPARTDRAGNGFGHLHGTANWYFTPPKATANQLEADLILDPSDLSEIATLLQGYDVGVHGTASGHASIDGPAVALRVSGELRLMDVHRWDLLPAAGEQLRIRYQGNVDLLAHTFSLETLPWHPNDPTPVVIQARVNDFLAHPAWSILARLNKAPGGNLLPLCMRMGVPLPEGLALTSTVDGAIGYSNRSGLAGGVALNDIVATLPNRPLLRIAFATAKISSGAVHFDPAVIQTPFPGTLHAGADYYPSTRRVVALWNLTAYPVSALNNTVGPWFSAPSALAAFEKGNLTGQLLYTREGTDPALWSGQLNFAHATLSLPALGIPLTQSEGRITFDHSTFNVEHFASSLGEETLRGEYHYNALLKHPEHLRLHASAADLSDIVAALDPTLRAQGLLARLHFGHRAIPVWLAARNLDADVIVEQFSVNRAAFGSLRSHLLWQGTTVQFNSVQLNLPEGHVSAHGTLNLATFSPHLRFAVALTAFPWRGGVLNAEGAFETSGAGSETVRNLRASGTFSGQDLSLSPEDAFSNLSGLFELSFDAGWPNVRLSKIEASQGQEAWIGEAASQSDGKLIFELENSSGQRRVISTLEARSVISPPLTETIH